ncbi:unnamed protein product [Mytilus coruscus]|uniref:Uncharacterized protein n=1 Tax=Mytilus coruscus TaxID=42192 RepID=A0A6J8E2T0_MYTCO|nr:unnamed protein product [Mytilus coruscus]
MSQRTKRNSQKLTSNRESRKRKANSNQEVLVLKLNFLAKANGSKSLREKILLKKTSALQRLEEENLKLKRKYQALTRKQQRINRKLSDTHSPRSKANKDIQEVISKKTSADKVRRKLVLYHTMINELKDNNKMIVDDMDNDKIAFSKWQRIDIGDGRIKIGLVNDELEANEFKIEQVKCADIFRQHVEMVTNQYDEIRKLKENLPNGHVLAQLDFAENYICTTYD